VAQTSSGAPTKSGGAKKGGVSQAIDFSKASWEEVKKVHTPTRQETMQATLVVIFMVILFSVFLGLVDYVVGNVMKAVLT